MSRVTEVFRERMRVRVHELDASQRCSPQSVCDLFQEAAGAHCRALGLSVEQLVSAHGETWMLHRLAARFHDLPRWRDEVTVETWPCGVDRIYALRDFRMLDDAGRVLAEGTSRWLIVDLESRRIARAPRTPIDWTAGREPGMPDAFRARVPTLERPAASHEFEVRRSEIDANGHVNHVHYLTWAFDAVPASRFDGSRVTALDAEYSAEALAGDTVMAEGAPEGDGNTWLHRVVRPADGRLLVKLRTAWEAER